MTITRQDSIEKLAAYFSEYSCIRSKANLVTELHIVRKLKIYTKETIISQVLTIHRLTQSQEKILTAHIVTMKYRGHRSCN